MAYTPTTVALLRKLRQEQGRPLRENAADIGIHRDRECDQHGWPDPRWHADDCNC